MEAVRNVSRGKTANTVEVLLRAEGNEQYAIGGLLLLNVSAVIGAGTERGGMRCLSF